MNKILFAATTTTMALLLTSFDSSACTSAQKQAIDAKRALATYQFLGNPSNSYVSIGSGCMRAFESGTIYAKSNTANVVYGLIRQKYNQMGGANGTLGFPLTDESNTADSAGRYNTFERGAILYHSQRGTFEVHGDIYIKWNQMGGVKSILGWPLTDETTTPDGIGRYNHFQNGSIYWHPCSGAAAIYGLIRNLWADQGWEKGYLGYPLSDELPTGDGQGRYNRFQRGYVLYHPTFGTFSVQDQIYQIWRRDGGVSGVWGYPKSTAWCNTTSCSQQFSKGTITYKFSHEGADLRNEINLRGIAIRNQGGRGTCSVQAMTFLLEYAYTQMCGDSYKHLSVEYLNHLANKATDRSDDGDFFSSIEAGYNQYGIINESRLPYNSEYSYNYSDMDQKIKEKDLEKFGADMRARMKFSGTFLKPINTPVGLTNPQMELILTFLDRGVPVAIGRGHSMVLVGYEKGASFGGGGRFLFRNSYGVGTGDQGYQWENFDSVKSTANDAYYYNLTIRGYQPIIH